MAPTNGKAHGTEQQAAAAARGDWGVFFRPYKLDDALLSLSLPKRTAHLLDWAAKRAPGVLIPYNIIYKCVMGFSHTPRLANEDVQRFRSGSLTSSRIILQRQFKRDLKNVSRVGARATVDSLDVVKATLPANVRRVNSAHGSLERAAKLVDAAKLPEAGPDKGWTQWYARTVTPALKALAADERLVKLLPPPPPKTSDATEPKPEAAK